MEVCDFCASFVLGGECTNLNCQQSKSLRKDAVKKKVNLPTAQPSSHLKSQNSNSAKGAFLRHYQPGGGILVPADTHLQYEVSIPGFIGYKTDKKSEQEYRRNVLHLLFNSEFQSIPKAMNQSAIGEFGSPKSAKRKTKILSWFDGRIYKSQSKSLQNSRAKLIEDRAFVSDNF